jgi:hypothetical protein
MTESQIVVPEDAFARLEELADGLDLSLDVAEDGRSITVGTVDNPDYHIVIVCGNGEGPKFNGYNGALIAKLQKAINDEPMDTYKPQTTQKPTPTPTGEKKPEKPKKPKKEPAKKDVEKVPESSKPELSTPETDVPSTPQTPGAVISSAPSANQTSAASSVQKPGQINKPPIAPKAGVMSIRPAARQMGKLKMAVTGQTGAGKTATSLHIAYGITGKWEDIVLIDTEESGDNYEGQIIAGVMIGAYNVLKLDRPYTADKYIQALETVENGGFKVAIIDSLSHAWIGSGGAIDLHDKEFKSGVGNSYTSWSKPKKKNRELLDKITHSKVHTISTMRSKMETAMVEIENGKKEVRNFGLKPIQEKDTEYEFDLVIDMGRDHSAHVTKDRTNQFNDEYFDPGVQTGNTLIKWLNKEL